MQDTTSQVSLFCFFNFAIDRSREYILPVHALLSMSIHLEQTKFSKSPKFDVGSDWDSEIVFVNFSSPFPNQPAAKICIKHSIKHKISLIVAV